MKDSKACPRGTEKVKGRCVKKQKTTRMPAKKYIEEYIVPWEDDGTKLAYLKGELGYDDDYVREHVLHNKGAKREHGKIILTGF